MKTDPGAGALLITCEHGGNDVPTSYRTLFSGHEALLSSHRGWDPGTLKLARRLSGSLDAFLVSATTTRLLVDLNRSPHNPSVFSSISRKLARTERLGLLQRFHHRHWTAVRSAVDDQLSRGQRLLHLGIHSFTPLLDGKVRRPDIALLYDPARPTEKALAGRWVRALKESAPQLVIGRNDPYRGNQDGLTTALRKEYLGTRYLGIEIEANQRLLQVDGAFPQWVGDVLATTLLAVLASESNPQARQT